MKPTRQLTHTLVFDKWQDRWSCSCGYVLGTGHERLYALCPEANPDGYIEFDISTPTYDKKTPAKKANIPATPKRQAGRRVARIYRKGEDLFGS